MLSVATDLAVLQPVRLWRTRVGAQLHLLVAEGAGKAHYLVIGWTYPGVWIYQKTALTIIKNHFDVLVILSLIRGSFALRADQSPRVTEKAPWRASQ